MIDSGRIRSVLAASLVALVLAAGWGCGGGGGGSAVRPCDEHGEESDQCWRCMGSAYSDCDRFTCAKKFEAADACFERLDCDEFDWTCFDPCLEKLTTAIDCSDACVERRCGHMMEVPVPIPLGLD